MVLDAPSRRGATHPQALPVGPMVPVQSPLHPLLQGHEVLFNSIRHGPCRSCACLCFSSHCLDTGWALTERLQPAMKSCRLACSRV